MKVKARVSFCKYPVLQYLMLEVVWQRRNWRRGGLAARVDNHNGFASERILYISNFVELRST